MLKAIVIPAIMLVTTPSIAHADDTDTFCKYMKAQSPNEQLAYQTMRDLWPKVSCDLPMANELPDLFDMPVVIHVGRMIQTFGADATPDTMDRSRRRATDAAYSMSKLDRARFEKEIAKAPAAAKTQLIRAFEIATAQAKEVNAWRAKQTKKVAKKVWQTGWDDAIAHVNNEWSTYGADFSLAIAALQKAKEDETCPDVRSRLFDVVKKAAPKTRDEIQILLHRTDFELLLVATASCEKDPHLAALLGNLHDVLDLRTRFEGPAAMVGSMIYGAFRELKDQGKTDGVTEPKDVATYMVNNVELPRLKPYYESTSDGASTGLYQQAVYGEIASKKPSKQKGFTTVTFKKVDVDAREMNCKRTNRIARITEDGSIEYFEDCTPGKSFKSTVSPSPIDVPTLVADQMKPKNFVMLAALENGQQKGRHRMAFPLELYSDKSRKQLVGLFGARWK